MSAASRLQSEDQFLCSICLDVFTDPVSTSCGHNFCRTCITQHWDSNVQCVCPLCKKMFHTRPELEVNRLLSEVVAELRQSRQNKASRRSEEPAAKPGEVQCDVCTGTKLKAIKSCLKCEASYCQTHLEPHRTAARLRSHQLIHPVDNLEDRMCKKHKKSLELFCKTDQTCVCSLCTVLDHRNHEFVPLEEEYEGKKSELEKTEAEIQQKMQQTCLKIQEINQSEKLSREAADRKKAEGLQIFTTLKQHVADIQADFMETVEEMQRSTKKQAEDFIKELQQELSEQRERAAEVEKLLLSEDHLHLLQSFSSISCAPPTKDWTEVRVHQRSHEGSLVKAVAQLEETISKEVKELLKKVELRRIQQFAVDVTLDPDTAHPKLHLSDDGKQVYCGDVRKNLPHKPQRFDSSVCVLGKQSFSSGRFYFEVQVKGKTWWALGVTRETSNRKAGFTLRPQEGYWTVGLRNEDKFSAGYFPPVPLSLKSKPEKVGVFVDYEEGLVSFYDVDAAALIFSFTGCSFTHKLLPFFCPSSNGSGTNSAPLIISSVSHTLSLTMDRATAAPSSGGNGRAGGSSPLLFCFTYVMNKVPFTPDASSLLMQDTAQVTPVLNYRKRRSINQVILQRNRKRVRESESRAAVDWTEAEEKPEDQKFVHSTAASQPNSDMSAASRLQSEDQFLCSICLGVFTDPVSTSCGHNFCRTCITQHWDSNVQCVCPLCKKMFHTRPELEVNRLLSEVAAEFRQSRQNEASRRSEEPAAKPGEVQCDVCTGTKLKAIKSCLKCEASYCQTHLEPHLTAARLRSHQLIHPVDNLEDRMCKKHKKSLELFCKTDQTCVCSLCTVLDHRNHEFVPLEEGYEGKKSELEKMVAEIQQKMQQTQLKIQEINQSEKLSREAADRKKAEGLQIFTTLKQHVEDIQADFMETVEEKQRSTKKQAEDFIKELQQELSEQRERAAEVEKLLLSEDHLHLLQSFSSISCAPPTKDWTEVRVHQRSHEGSLEKAVAQLEETISKEVKELLKVELKRIQQFAVNVTLDPDTAYPQLILSDDGKQVYCGDVRKKLPDKPQRFDSCSCVLGKQSFSSGRFYFEVQVKGKTEWDVGVTRETSERKGVITVSPQRGYWTVRLRNEDKFSACDDALVPLSLESKPEKVGVFVDYEEGLVSFYDVDAAALIFSFTGCSFTHKLLPYFCPCHNDGGRNSAPLIISAVSHPE
ncbi:uncharacterized protein LOC143016302 [Genypterus blacodes]|uniref:uncharacterized protein LOC143016302 n=1 Tax=Genypterus blacodes TaxID=154954 RepID=UPI003F763B13